ncbi:hypothetical protein ACS3SW_05565 [Roseobacteraceae bacterium S113]
MKYLTLPLLAVLLAGCGADGAPIRPEPETRVTIGTDGASVSRTQGAVTVTIGN